MDQVIAEMLPLVLAAVGFGVWLVRLEYRANQNTKDLEALEHRLADQRKEDLARRAREWEAMNQRLDGLDTKIDGLPERLISIMRTR